MMGSLTAPASDPLCTPPVPRRRRRVGPLLAVAIGCLLGLLAPAAAAHLLLPPPRPLVARRAALPRLYQTDQADPLLPKRHDPLLPNEDPNWNAFEYCERLTVPELRTYLARRGVLRCSRTNRTGLLLRLRELEGEGKWRQYEAAVAAVRNATISRIGRNARRRARRMANGIEAPADPVFPADDPRADAGGGPVGEDRLRELERRRAYYEGLTWSDVRLLMRSRGLPRGYQLSRPQCVAALAAADRVAPRLPPLPNQPLSAAQVDQERDDALLRDLNSLSLPQLRQVAARAGLRLYSKLLKGGLIDLLLTYLKG